jgi:hypothetical protein
VIDSHSHNALAQTPSQEKRQQRKQPTHSTQARSPLRSRKPTSSIEKQKQARKSPKSRTLVVRLCLRKGEAMTGRDKFSDDGNNLVAEAEVLRTAALGLRTRSTSLKYR